MRADVDWEGTERMRTTYNGSVADSSSFTSLAFGDAQTTVSGSDIDQYHFAQLDSDSESDTDHAQFRQYSSTEGHWMSPDPYAGSYDISNPQSMNRYAYVQNSPLSYVDPMGLVICFVGTDEVGNAINVSVSTYGECTAMGGIGVYTMQANPGNSGNNSGAWGNMEDIGATEVFYFGGGGVAYGPGASGGGGGGANTGLTLKQIKCGALAGLPVAIDAASLAADFFGPEGQAAKIATGFGLSLAATFTSAANGDAGTAIWGAASFTRAPLELGAKSMGSAGLASGVFRMGVIGDGISAIHDISGVKSSYGACMAR